MSKKAASKKPAKKAASKKVASPTPQPGAASMTVQQARQRLNITVDLIPQSNSNRPGTPMQPQAITIHNTDNSGNGANARAHASYMKGQDAQDRKVSWHFSVDDGAVYQSLPVNEVGWHAGNHTGNATTIGIEICQNQGIDQAAANTRAALLTALMLRELGIAFAGNVKQHHDWSGKDCPKLLRHPASRWTDFLSEVAAFHAALSAGGNLPASHDHAVPAGFFAHLFGAAPPPAGVAAAPGDGGGQCTNGWLVTGYFTAAESQYHGPMKQVDVSGHGMESFPADFLKHVSIEGWGRTRFGWFLGWDHGWLKGDSPLNAISGALKIGSLAVDRQVIPLGSKVRIPTLPAPWDQQVFVADDVGGGIQGRHVDVYCGDGEQAEQETFRITAHEMRLCVS